MYNPLLVNLSAYMVRLSICMPRKIINIISPHFSPEITAAAHRMEVAAKTLSRAYKVNVFTLTERGSKLKSHQIKCDENLTVNYLAVKSYSKSFFLVRALFEWWYSLKLVRESNKVKADLVIVSVPFIFLLPVVARYSTARKKIADIRDLVWHYLPATTFFKKIIKARLASWMHRSLSKFDSITITNEAEKRWLLSCTSLSEEKLKVIPNGVSTEKFFKLSEMKYVPHTNKFTITYIGNIGSSQHFLSLIDAVKDMLDVRLNLIGDGNEWKNVEKYITNHNIRNVFLHSKKHWIHTLPFYQTSNLLFASLKEEYDTAIPSKLYEYLATGLPVLYLGNGAASNFLGTYKNTFLVLSYETRYLEKMIWNIKRLAPVRATNNIHTIGKLFLREKLSARFIELAAGLLNEKNLSTLFVEDILLSTEF